MHKNKLTRIYLLLSRHGVDLMDRVNQYQHQYNNAKNKDNLTLLKKAKRELDKVNKAIADVLEWLDE